MEKTIDLKDRPTIGGPVFTASYSPNDTTIGPWEPEAGNTVTLKSGEVTILVRITEAKARQYKGEVMGFERWDDEEYRGVKAGDTLSFRYQQMFGCMR